MRMLSGNFVIALVLAWMICEARAQPPGGPPPGMHAHGPGFGGFGPVSADKLMLLSQKPIQKELKITDQQQKLIEQLMSRQTQLFQNLREMSPDKMEHQIGKQSKSNDVALNKLLTPEQTKRLSQITLQLRGPQSLGDVAIAKSLDLNTAQKSKIKRIQAEAQRDLQASTFERRDRARGSGFGAPPAGLGGPQAIGAPDTPEQQAAHSKAFEKMALLRQGADAKLLNVLNSEQQTQWQEMQGEPFTFEMQPPNILPASPAGDAGTPREIGRRRNNKDVPQ
jgi:hypothetical protein